MWVVVDSLDCTARSDRVEHIGATISDWAIVCLLWFCLHQGSWLCCELSIKPWASQWSHWWLLNAVTVEEALAVYSSSTSVVSCPPEAPTMPVTVSLQAAFRLPYQNEHNMFIVSFIFWNVCLCTNHHGSMMWFVSLFPSLIINNFGIFSLFFQSMIWVEASKEKVKGLELPTKLFLKSSPKAERLLQIMVILIWMWICYFIYMYNSS